MTLGLGRSPRLPLEAWVQRWQLRHEWVPSLALEEGKDGLW